MRAWSRKGFLVAVYVCAFGLLALVPVLAWLEQARLDHFTRDVFTLGTIPVWTGLVSNVGAMTWAATAGICFFAAVTSSGAGRERGLLAGGGLISGVLLFDDFFAVHEWVAPDIVGIPEEVVYSVYVTLIGGLLIGFRREILDRRPGLLATALGLLGVSLGIDQFLGAPDYDQRGVKTFIEDSFKFVGIATWFAYFVLVATDAVRPLRASDHAVEGGESRLVQ